MTQYHRTYWNQRAKVKQIRQADTNSNYFHRITNGRRNRKYIKEMTNENGDTITGNTEIRKEMRQNFISRYKKEQTNPDTLNQYLNLINNEISTEQNNQLTKQITNTEIKNAMFSIGRNKSPGPDGFPAEFFQKYWEIVGNSVCLATQFLTKISIK